MKDLNNHFGNIYARGTNRIASLLILIAKTALILMLGAVGIAVVKVGFDAGVEYGAILLVALVFISGIKGR